MKRAPVVDPISLEVFRHLFAAIPEEMGALLRAASHSPNIKERLDFSCALTGAEGEMMAQASHIPVHLGAVHVTGQILYEQVAMRPGDVICVNDPWRGGTHLPDITLFAPVFVAGRDQPIFGALVRAHHADVGGATPGSMGPAKDVHGEGLVIPPVRLVREGRMDEDLFSLLLANTRTPKERRGDLLAQEAAVRLGVRRLVELIQAYGAERCLAAAVALREHAALATRAMLSGLKDGTYRAEIRMDGPKSPKICVRIDKHYEGMRIDFAGTDPAIETPFNANRAITTSAVFYAIRLLLKGEVPTNSGCLDPIEIAIPAGSFLDAPRPSPVAGGNVETSQRIVDALMLALAEAAPDQVPACSQGTMNNLTVGSRGFEGEPWTFYETMGGGCGAGPTRAGASGLQSHMTNTLNTPIEALECAFPVQVLRYELRRNSGGAGARSGGEGLIRHLRFLKKTRVSLLAHRREVGAPGLFGGLEGAVGKDRVRISGRWRRLQSGEPLDLEPGDEVLIETPGGGGHGAAIDSKPERARGKRAQ